MTKALMFVEDRDLAYLVLDASIPFIGGAQIVDIALTPGIRFMDAENEDIAQWCQLGNTLTVVDRSTFDCDGDFDKAPGYPIPSPVIMLDMDEYNRRDQ